MLCDLSDKQQHALTHSDARLNIWEGSVRSGKSYSALLRFIEFAMTDIKGDMIICGKTEDAIKRNIISELSRLLGTHIQYYSGKREVVLFGRKIHVIGANDDRSEGKIRGASFAGALVDEATTIPEPFFKMLLSRLSIPGAKLFATTNPDSPYCWLKTDFLDRQEELDLKRFHFKLEDNPSLENDYKEALKREYTGLWYSRFIEGKWVLAEGSIYSNFDYDRHTITLPPGPAKYYIVGVDYGTINPMAFSLIACNPDLYPNLWVEKEYYWDSKKELRQKTDAEYAEDLRTFILGKHVKAIVVDPSAASFITECRKSGMKDIIEANNEVLTGIRYLDTLLAEGSLKIARNCENLIKEIQSYTWDEKAALRGEEKPKKVFDHILDATRYGCMYFFQSGFKHMTASELNQRYQAVMGNNQYNLPSFFRDDIPYR